MQMTDPRVTRSKAAVLAAAGDLLSEVGFAGVSVDEVSARSGVAKTTIYRHWPSRSALLADVCRKPDRIPPARTTDDLEADLVALLSGLARALRAAPWARTLASLVDAAERDPELRAVHRDVVRERQRPLREILERAIDRGDLPKTLDVDTAVALLVGPLFYRRFVSHDPVTPALARKIVESVLPTLRATRDSPKSTKRSRPE